MAACGYGYRICARSRSLVRDDSICVGVVPLPHRFETPGQNALLHVQAIFGLVEHHRLRTVDHLVGDFVAAMGGEAVHEQRVRFCKRHQPGVDLVRFQEIVAVLAVGAGENVVRLLPPLIVTEAEIKEGVQRLERACTALSGDKSKQAATQ